MKGRKQFNYAQRWKIVQQKLSQLADGKRLDLTLMVCFLLIVVLASVPWLWQYKLDYQLKELERRIADYNDVAALDQQVTELQAQASNMKAFIQMMVDNQKDPQAIIAQIIRLLPPASQMLSFTLAEDNTIEMTITSDKPVDLIQLRDNLKNSGLFKEFDIRSVFLHKQQQRLELFLRLK